MLNIKIETPPPHFEISERETSTQSYFAQGDEAYTTKSDFDPISELNSDFNRSGNLKKHHVPDLGSKLMIRILKQSEFE